MSYLVISTQQPFILRILNSHEYLSVLTNLHYGKKPLSKIDGSAGIAVCNWQQFFFFVNTNKYDFKNSIYYWNQVCFGIYKREEGGCVLNIAKTCALQQGEGEVILEKVTMGTANTGTSFSYSLDHLVLALRSCGKILYLLRGALTIYGYFLMA